MTSSQAAAIAVRRANARDEDLLLRWANDPTTRTASFRPAPIEASAHHRWLADRLASPSTRLLIGSEGPVPVGQVRFERRPDGAVEIGISVAPEARGRGLGRALLRTGLEAARRDAALEARSFVARIRVDNEVSARLFGGAGFSLRERTLRDGVPCLVFELDP